MAKAHKLSAWGTAAAAATLATATPSDAATILQSFNLNNGSNFTLQQFDTNLGTLESVNFMISPLASVNVANTDPGPGMAEFSIRGNISLDSADVAAPLLPSWQSAVMTRTFSKSDPFYQLDASGPNQNTLFTSGLTNFIGSSSFNYTMNSSVDVLSASAPYGDILRDRSRAVVQLTYNYNEAAAAVPEPATWAMMIGGLGLVGAAMRRRNRAGGEPTASL